MAKVSGIQNVFSGGEFSPLLDARSDLTKYNHGGKTMINCLATVQGPFKNRPGFTFVARTKHKDKKSRTMNFEFSTTQAYILEVGDLYIRFFRNHGSILNSNQNITGITQANPGVITIAGHGYSNGEELYIASIVGMTELNSKRYLAAGVTANTFTLTDLDGNAIDTSSFTAYGSGGTAASVYEVTTPYLEADLFQLKIIQSADVLYITHPNYAPRKLSRTGHTAWTLTTITFVDGPYLPQNVTTTTLSSSGTTGTVTITASAITGINDDTGFQSTDVGRLIRIKVGGGNWGDCTITAVGSTTSVTATVNATLTTGATTVWRLGLWSGTTGYPACSTFYENRLLFGGTPNLPHRFDGSNTGNYETFSPTDPDGTVPDDRSISFTLNSNTVNAIRWMIDDEKGLLIGTVGGEWLVRASTSNEVITPVNVKAVRSSTNGSADIQGIRVSQAVVFAQRSARRLRELAYVFEKDGFRAPDLTLMSEHITLGGITEIAYQKEPQSWIWMPRADGVLLNVNYVREQDVVGWGRHIIGGTDPLVESVAVIPVSDSSREELWATTSRTINSQTVRFMEYMGKIWEAGDLVEDSFFVDAGLTYDGAATSTLSGLDHLEGESVTILADGSTHPNKTVVNGAITLDRSASKISVGLGYESDFGSVKPDLGSQDGTAQSKRKRVHRVAVRFWQTVNAMVGPDETKLHRIIFREGSDPMTSPVPLFTGDKFAALDSTYDDGEVFIRQDQPLPLNVLAIILYMATHDP